MRVSRVVTGGVAVLLTVGAFAAGNAIAGSRANVNGKAAAISHAKPAFTAAAIKTKGAAVINSDGTIAEGSTKPYKATAASHLGTGIYEVDFSGNVQHCAYNATIGLAGTAGASAPGFITVVGRVSNPVHGLFIETFDTAGTLTDLGFHLTVTC
jgi:hypothetical protein